MKKLYSLITLSTLGIMGLSAQSYHGFTTLDDAKEFGGFQPFGISNNGRYICGQTFNLQGFIYDTQESKAKVFTTEDGSDGSRFGVELRAVNSKGEAIGFDDNGGVFATFDGKYELVYPVGTTISYVILNDISDDGNIMVGAVSEASYAQHAAYWENGVGELLEVPTSEEAGFYIKGSQAIGVSADGSVILGNLIDRYNFNPMVLWLRQEDGTYALSKVYEKHYEPESGVPYYDEDGNLIYPEAGDNPFIQFSPGAITSDGKVVAVYIQENDGEYPHEMKLGYYFVDTDEVEVVSDEGGLFNRYSEFIIQGIADDKTVVGTLGSLAYGTNAFIYYYDTPSCLTFAQAFPTLSAIQSFEAATNYGTPFLGTGINASAQYIIGYSVLTDIDLNLLAGDAFYIDTLGEDNGEGAVEEINSEVSGENIYYNLQGIRQQIPTKGLNIIRYPDGSTRKAILR